MYALTIKPRAESDLRRLSAPIHSQVFNKPERLCEMCDDYPHKALKGEHRGKFSLSVAKNYWVLYTFDRRIREIVVHRVGHRSRIY